MQHIISQHDTKINSLPPDFTADDFKTEIRKLDDLITIAEGELQQLEAAHEARPYRPEFMATMRSGYGSSLRDLHSQIANVRRMLEA